TNYDYFRLLEKHDQFAIVSNPPYFLYNRILSLTGTYLAPEDSRFKTLEKKFCGALMITGAGRLSNHPGWAIKSVLPDSAFSTPAAVDQYLIQTGFQGRILKNAPPAQSLATAPQRYVSINNRNPVADPTDTYPEMWQQLEALRIHFG